MHNMVGRIGGDSSLSGRGRQYAATLASYIDQQQIPGLRVWTSWMKRAIQTVKDVKAPQERWKALNEIDAVSSPVYSDFFLPELRHINVDIHMLC